jgi:hypothetical protein
VNLQRRLELLEDRAKRHVAEAKGHHSDARRHMREHLGRAAAQRRGELGPEEAAEVEAVNAAFKSRLAQIRGEGGLLD